MPERAPDAVATGSSSDSAGGHSESAAPEPRRSEETGAWPHLQSGIEILVSGAAVVYALGYLAWAIVLWEHDIGLPPALEGQYLIAGLVPAAILGLFVLVVVALLRLLELIRRRVTKVRARCANILRWAATGLVLSGFVGSALFGGSKVGDALIVAGLLGFVASWLFAADNLDRWAARGLIWYFIVAAPFLFLVPLQWFATRLFVHLPAEFGGPTVQTVRLDIAPAELAAETLVLLGLPPSPGAETIRTGPLRVLMVPGDFHVIMAGSGGKPVPVKIKADIVRAIVPER